MQSGPLGETCQDLLESSDYDGIVILGLREVPSHSSLSSAGDAGLMLGLAAYLRQLAEIIDDRNKQAIDELSDD